MVLGTGIPLALFLIWNAVILGTPSSVVDASGAMQAISDPLLRLRSASGIVGVSLISVIKPEHEEEISLLEDNRAFRQVPKTAKNKSAKTSPCCEYD